MIKIIMIITTIILSFSAANANDAKCNTVLSKLKAECNFIGKGFNKMRSFSEKNKTIDQSINNTKKGLDNIKGKVLK
tara:strand:+ start:176 stop:406 length:231 start_codon:yes stop_codon:yes gene_type:complete